MFANARSAALLAACVLAVLLAARGCDCGSGKGPTLGGPCSGGFECDPGQICFDGFCVWDDGGASEGRFEVPEGYETFEPGVRMGPGTDNPFAPERDNSDGVGLDDRGDLILDSGLIRMQYLWVANSGEGTVSKIDTFADPPVEVGRFFTGLDDDSADPSRTSVDLAGDVFVANRAHNYPAGADDISSVSKIAALEERCLDRNENGTIETSRGSTPLPRGDGSGGVPAGQSTDECVLWTRDFQPSSARATDLVTPLGCRGARAVTATPESGPDFVLNGHAWVGCYDDLRAYKVDGNTGDLLAVVGTSPCAPYGFLMGIEDIMTVWVCCRDMDGDHSQSISTLDPRDGSVTALPEIPGNPYGFAMDADGGVWATTMPSTPSSVLRYSAAAGWQALAEPSAGFFDDMRGIAVDEDGYAWAVATDRAEVWLIDAATFPAASSLLEVLPTTNDPAARATAVCSGAAVDFDGNVWAVCMGGDGGDFDGWVTKYRVDRTTGRPIVDLAGHPERMQMVQVGRNPYTYSDMLGYHLRRFTAREGWYRQVFEACPMYSVRWNEISWDAFVPEGTRVVFRGRTGDTREELARAGWVLLAEEPGDESPADIPAGAPPSGLSEGHYIELEIRLYTDRDGLSPTVHAVSFDWSCTTPIF
ncbi:MAG: hypothetical protein HY905_07970 [Deltaproteobacteria bacterium]|nr:hypothetical protein [Deltaproteobacteria bacterium]